MSRSGDSSPGCPLAAGGLGHTGRGRHVVARAFALAFALALALAGLAVFASAHAAPWSPAPASVEKASRPSIDRIELRNTHGALVTQVVPNDTLFVDVFVRDTSGFRNVGSVEFGLSRGTYGTNLPTWQAFGANWTRGAFTPWQVRTTASNGWRLLTSLCAVDVATNSSAAQPVRFAFVVCPVARADSGGWQVQAWVGSVTAKAVGFGVRPRVTWAALDTLGRFAANSAGTANTPLTTPSTGRLTFRLVSNTPVALHGRASAFTGTTVPAQRFGGGASDTTLRWMSADLPRTTAGYLDSLVATLGDSIAASVDTAATMLRLDLRLAIPASAQVQAYSSNLALDMASPAGSAGTLRASLAATVLGGALAAHSAVAEAEPHRVNAGASAQPMTARLGFAVGAGETGINRVRVALPLGWSSPRVTSVTATMFGFPIGFRDASSAEAAVANLMLTSQLGLLTVYFTANAPTLADSIGAEFRVYFDDTTNATPEQVAIEGNPDFIGESGWRVAVLPAAAARLDLAPTFANLVPGDSLSLAARITDAFGNLRRDPVSWLQLGAAGSVDANGRFAALAAGTSRVVATSGALSDTARMVVTDPAAGVHLSMPAVARVRLLPADAAVEMAQVLVTNDGAGADTLDALELVDASRGPATPAQLEGSWSGFEAWDTTGTQLATGSWNAGRVRFDRFELPLPGGSSRRLSIRAGASRRARDADSLGLAVDGGALTLHSGRPALLANASPATLFPVDGMSAAQVSIEPFSTGPLFAGTRRREIAELHVPANGYAPDRLLRLNVANRGTAEAGLDLQRLEAWLDDGDHVLDTLADRRLGALLFTGDRWELTGLSADVPDTSLCVLLSADVAAGARDGRTVRLALPTEPDVALGMQSGNSGPIDREVVSDHEEVIGGGERVLVTATLLPGGVTHAGARSLDVLELVLANGYTAARHLRSLTLTNTSWGAGTPAQLDGSFARVVLRPAPLGFTTAATIAAPLAVGSFTGGRLTFGGLDLDIEPGAEVRLQVGADVDPQLATDGDHLAMSVGSPLDVVFAEASMVGGTWPVASGTPWIVDGFVAAQAPVHPVSGLTLAPLDGPVAALDLQLPANGYLADVLHGVRVVNLGDADPAGIGELRLFRDGGDGRFGGIPSDDVDLGPLVRIGTQWQSAYLSEAMPAGGRRFFVGLTVAGSTGDSSTVQLAVPAGGVEMESGDDGPLDAGVSNPEPHVLSTRPLIASLALDPASSTVGQQVDVRMHVRNVGGEAVNAVAPGSLVAEGTAAFDVLAGPAPGPVRLAAGGDTTFVWTVRSTTAGELRFAALGAGTGASSGLERRSLVAHSGTHPVFMEADSLRLVALQSMPSAVNLGQPGVVPLTLTLEHPGDASSSEITFRRLRVRLEQESGAPVVPSTLATTIEVREGTTVYLRRTNLETTGDVIDLTLASPATLRPDNPVSLALQLDIAASTTVPSFRLVIDDSSSFVAEDAISGRPVRVRLQGQSYPVRSGLARLLTGGGGVRLSGPAPVTRTASRGQSGVTLATWQAAHSSTLPSSADLRLNSILVRAWAPGGVSSPAPWSRWRVIANGLEVGQHLAAAVDTGDVRIDLAPAPIVQPGAPVTLRLEADLVGASPSTVFVVDATRTSQWDVRDVNSGDPAPVWSAAVLGGDTLRVEQPATALVVSPLARMPATVAVGRVRLPALSLVLRNPGPAGAAAVRLDSVHVALRSPNGQALPMEQYLSAVRLTRRGLALDARANPTGSDLALGAACALRSGALDTVTVEIDVAGTASAGSIELRVPDRALQACDANSGAGVAVTPEPPADWPFGSGAALLVTPARELRASASSEMPALLAPAGTARVPAASLVLHHPGPAGSGPIAVDHVVVSAAGANGAPLPLGGVAATLELRLAGALLSQSATLAVDSATATLAFAAPVEIAAEDSAVFALSFQPRAADPAQRFRLGWQAAGIGVVQPASAALAVAVLPSPGAAFPLWSDVAGFAPNRLDASYANFPNPFAAGREATTFAFLMPGPGRVTLRIWTARGEPVLTVLDAAALPAGLRQADRWDGRNGRGDVVTNGVYVAELDVRLDDGRHERVLRKVAVVR